MVFMYDMSVVVLDARVSQVNVCYDAYLKHNCSRTLIPSMGGPGITRRCFV
jgi:hypothetical protein